MKKAVFIGSADRVAYVYAKSTLDKLHAELDFVTDHVIAKSEIDTYRAELASADYIFSTWGMPSFTREEIREYLPNVKAVFYGAGETVFNGSQQGRIFLHLLGNTLDRPPLQGCLARSGFSLLHRTLQSHLQLPQFLPRAPRQVDEL